jgi:hypothetical protein
MVRDDVIVITTPESATELEVRVYDCRDCWRCPPWAGKWFLFAIGSPGWHGRQWAVACFRWRTIRRRWAIRRAAVLLVRRRYDARGGMAAWEAAASSGRSLSSMTSADRRDPADHRQYRPRLLGRLRRPGSIHEYNGLIVVTQTGQTRQRNACLICYEQRPDYRVLERLCDDGPVL